MQAPTLHPVTPAPDVGLKLLVAARDELQAERSRVANRLDADLLVLVPGYSERIPNLVAARHLSAVSRLLIRSSAIRAKVPEGA